MSYQDLSSYKFYRNSLFAQGKILSKNPLDVTTGMRTVTNAYEPDKIIIIIINVSYKWEKREKYNSLRNILKISMYLSACVCMYIILYNYREVYVKIYCNDLFVSNN